MRQAPPFPAELKFTQKQIFLGLVTVFSIYIVMSFSVQTILIARPRMAADLNGMALYAWSISIPSLAAAFVTLLFSKFSDMYGRRKMLLISMVIYLAGTICSALSPTYPILIAANTVSRVGNGALFPLVFAVLGDMYPPAERSKWVGLLNIPQGFFALFGPTLGGWFVDDLTWRYIFWCAVPLLIICLAMALFGLPGRIQQAGSRIDSRGAVLAAVASSTMILGFSMAGTMYPWISVQVIGSLAASIVFWVLFMKAEAAAEAPILDIEVLKNRSFITIAAACLFSSFGMVGLTIYYPLLMQGVQGETATSTGQIMTLGNVLMNFLGVPAGFLLARTRRYKWMYVAGYGLTLLIMSALIFFNAATPVSWGFVAFTLAGIGMGAIPTLNTLVAQYSVPKRLLGVAMGALYFSVMIGNALAPAILGSAMNMNYNSTLKTSLPAEVSRMADQAAMTSLGNPRVLLNEPAMESLRATLNKTNSNGEAMLDQTVSSIRLSMEAGLRIVFILGAVAMLLTFLIICTIPEVPIEASQEKQ